MCTYSIQSPSAPFFSVIRQRFLDRENRTIGAIYCEYCGHCAHATSPGGIKHVFAIEIVIDCKRGVGRGGKIEYGSSSVLCHVLSFPREEEEEERRGESGGGGYDPFRDFLHFTLLLQHFRRLKIRYLALARVLDFVTPSSRQQTEEEGFYPTVLFFISSPFLPHFRSPPRSYARRRDLEKSSSIWIALSRDK